MQEFEGLINQNTDWFLTLSLSFFSVFVAIFYTLIFSTFYSDELKPKWLFFVLLPSSILLTKLAFNKYVIVTFLIIFIGTFLLLFIGAIYKGINSFQKTINKRLKKEKTSSVYFSVFKNLLLAGIAVTAFFLLGTYAFIFIFFAIIIKAIFSKSNKKTFLNLQANLPTSKIQSMAMGLVEVMGNTIIQEPLLSRIGKKQCIGYRYKIEKIRKDKDGKNQYSTISNEVVCNNFLLKDSTGQVQVLAEDIDFLWIEKDDSYSSAGKRYTQYLLQDNQEIMLIGKASSKAKNIVIEKEPIKNIFTLAPNNAVTKWNRNKPLLNSFFTYLTLLFFIIALILITEINIAENTIHFKFNLSWDNISIFNIFK